MKKKVKEFIKVHQRFNRGCMRYHTDQIEEIKFEIDITLILNKDESKDFDNFVEARVINFEKLATVTDKIRISMSHKCMFIEENNIKNKSTFTYKITCRYFQTVHYRTSICKKLIEYLDLICSKQEGLKYSILNKQCYSRCPYEDEEDFCEMQFVEENKEENKEENEDEDENKN